MNHNLKKKKMADTLQLSGVTCSVPEQLDTGLDGAELYNSQLGKGEFCGELFRASIGSATLDVGNYNDVPITCQGALGDRLFFAIELFGTGTSIHLNGEQLGQSAIACYPEQSEFFFRQGKESCRWLSFQVERKELERMGCILPHDHFSIIRIAPRRKQLLVNALLQLLTSLRAAESHGTCCLDTKMTKNHLLSLFSLALGSADKKPEKLHNSEYLKLVKQITEYMEAHLDERITMLDLCRLSGKSESTLKRAFKRIYSTNPRSYLSTHRLNAVQRKLLQSAPKRTTVTDTALQHGFLHMGRFSAEYNKHFGELPSATMARVKAGGGI